jgi:hypothetical protein
VREGLTLVGAFPEGTTVTRWESDSVAKKNSLVWWHQLNLCTMSRRGLLKTEYPCTSMLCLAVLDWLGSTIESIEIQCSSEMAHFKNTMVTSVFKLDQNEEKTETVPSPTLLSIPSALPSHGLIRIV